ncbi:hypothetical protein K1X12_10580 [Hyphomonas sp. WL0036]|uniref:hypothetical protein n=1 Tax=Hyphomonas sediminis TaxID=2866160 RepID=UPI001C800D93|nr:hypothetical protein [Hyphomonas sediminis]MBY9067347.1 hypothetical protein [Hyphomonas sediminis]
MKFIIINSFRTMIYVAYIAIIVAGIALGIYQKGQFTGELLGLTGTLSQLADFAVFAFGGWVAASLICGLIVTLLDIRDDINDRLPDARRDM